MGLGGVGKAPRPGGELAWIHTTWMRPFSPRLGSMTMRTPNTWGPRMARGIVNVCPLSSDEVRKTPMGALPRPARPTNR
jgi:hypothetical protein